ncbi:MAG: T9SS type A sorting domain-containing protein [Lewinellaceae bacterium]|nr:T9SS type A sorting domain-containing protein [Lewinellaceae bacterium]
MERTRLNFASPSSWFSAIALVLVFGLAGLQQASAQFLSVTDASGGTPPSPLNFTPPEGDCGVNLQWAIFALDPQGVPTVTATASNPNLGVFPSVSLVLVQNTATQVSYALYINAAIGTNTVTVTSTGPSGTVQQTFVITATDVRIPEIYAPSTITLEVPGCDADGLVPLNYSYSVVDDCDVQPAVTVVGPASGTLVGANTTVVITAVDDSGNTSSRTINVVVNVQPDDSPVLNVSGNGQFTVPACEDNVFVIFSGTVIDCDITAATDNSLGGAFAARLSATGAGLALTYVDTEDGYAYFEYTGNLVPNTYLFFVTYDNGVAPATTVDALLTVEQDAPQPPDVIMPGNLTFTLPQCTNSMVARWAVTITDECDAAINGATFQLNGAPIVPVSSNPADGYFQFETPITAASDGAVITASYTDGDMLNTTVDATLQVVAQPDTWAPVIVYPAQDINVELDPCETDPAFVFFEVTATDNCSGDVTPVVTVAPGALGAFIIPSPGGDTYILVAGPGVYQILIEATDAAGNLRQEDFFVTVTQDPAPPTNLACNDDINVTLDANCQRLITADMVLEGSFGCATESDFFVNIVNDDDPTNGNILDGCGQFIYEVSYIGPTLTGPGQSGTQVQNFNSTGFTGPFAEANWTVDENLGNGGAGAIADVSFTTSTMTIQTLTANYALASIIIPNDGHLSFSWDYNGADPNFDFFLFDLNGGNLVNVTNAASGTFDDDVQAGWLLMFEVNDDDFLPIGAAVPSTAVISNLQYSYQTVVNGDPVWPYFNWEPCWGYITGEDKTKPILDCPPNTNQACVDVTLQAISGALATTDPTVNPANYSCFQQLGTTGGAHRYDLNYFQVDVEDYYTFYIVPQGGWEPDLAMYQGSYTAGNPCENIIGFADAGVQIQPPVIGLPGAQPFTPSLAMTLPLRPYEDYYLFVTSDLANITGAYTVYVRSQNSGRIGTWVTTTTTNPVSWDVTTTTTFNPYAGAQLGTICFDLVCDDLNWILNNPASPAWTGRPTATDNCGVPTVTFTDTYVTPGDCAPTTLTRHFKATDSKGNSSVCDQVITIRKLVLGDVYLPPFTVPIECDEDFVTLPNGNPSPESTGWPFISTAQGIILINDSYCNLGAAYEDGPRITVCDGAYKFVRTWSILDWCDPSAPGLTVLTYPQTIKVGDYTPPAVTCPQVDYGWGPQDPEYSTSPFSCTASFTVPLPDVTDNCSSWQVLSEIVTEVEVEDYNQYGILIGTHIDTVVVRTIPWNAPTRVVSGIPLGNHYFRYTTTDACGNKTVTYCDFSVKDKIEPVAVCDDNLNISIGGGDFARVFAEDIDEGSWDNCEIDRIEVRRNKFDPINYTCGTAFSAWGPYVDFFCCDVGVEVTIELRVIDKAGNINTCWLYVTPEEKVRPYCYAPHNTNIDCDDLPYSFDPTDIAQLQDLFGAPSADDNCEATATELPPAPNLNCGFGTIIRRFRATDIHGNQSNNFCQQVVTINEVHNYEIKFPADASEICGTPSPDSVTYEEIGCDLLAVSSNDEFFSASGDECYKIFRTWKVVNWCQYDGESDPFIVGRDEDCDNQPGDECVWVLHRPNGYTYIDRDNDETEPNNIPLAFQNICWGIDDFWRKVDEATPGYYQYLQIIKVYDNIDPKILYTQPDDFCSYDNVNCTGLVTYPFQIDENCTPDDLTIKVFLDANADGTIDADLTNSGALSGTYPNYTITGNFPIGCHAFEVHVEDGCGNADAELLPFCVVDCKPPAPTCINGLAIELMPFDSDGDGTPDTGQMAIWASDFIVSPMTDCTGPVKYSINRSGDPVDPAVTGLTLTCADTGTLVVEIWAWDGAGNGDFCETYILVQDNQFDLCGGATLLAVSGAVATEVNDAVENVEVSLSGQGSATMMTTATGSYVFNGEEGYDYTVTPQRDGDYLNGVSTFDLVLISKHILGVQPLNSPYKMIAADVNNSESITTLDLIQLRKLILSIDTEFTNNTSWRFVERAYAFPNPSNPWFEDFPEVVNINNLPATGISNADFVAVKVGDVNLDAQTNSFTAVEERNMVSTFAFNVADASVNAGNEYTVTFAAGSADVDGYQGTLMFDNAALELVDIIGGVATEENFGLTRVSEGAIATSWNGNVEAGQPLFSLVFRAKAEGQLSQLLSVSNRVVKSEAYNRAGEYMDVAIQFSNGTVASAGFELYQNTPNPFKGETMIGFNLPADAQATLTISDITGKVLKLVRVDGVKGYNQVVVNSNGLPTGVLAYTVETADFTATKKMVIVE